MKRTFTIEVTLDTETAYIEELSVTEGLYNRTEFVSDGEKTSIYETVRCIEEELKNWLD